MSKKEKVFLTEFIELYKSFPCLWKIKSKEYSDRNAKSQAYEILAENMRTLDETANRETVVKKINSLRTTYRKELKKVLDSERSGAGADDMYVPHLWYYELMSFLKDQETPRNTVSNMDEESESHQISDANGLQTDVDTISEPITPHSITSEPSTSRSISQASSRQAKRRNDKCDEVLEIIQKRLTTPSNVDDKFTLLGKTWASKLRELPQDQAIHAEKLINDVFYEAQLQTLNRYCTLNVQPQQPVYLQSRPSHYQQMQTQSSYNQPSSQISVSSLQELMPPSRKVPFAQAGPSSQTGSYYQHSQPSSQDTEQHQQQSDHSRNTQLPRNQLDQEDCSESQTISEYVFPFRPTDL